MIRTHSTSARPARSKTLVIVAVLAAIASSCTTASHPRAVHTTRLAADTTTSRVASPTQPENLSPPENVAFYYQGITRTTDLSRLGNVAIVVTGKAAPAYAPSIIHRSEAKAYRGVQAYWFAGGDSYDGLEVSKRLDWAFCSQGATPLVARTDRRNNPWYFLDGNERGARDAFAARLTVLKAEGWDGIFFDRGYAAMTGIDEQPNPAWNTSSTCTEDPVLAGATQSDTYLGLASEVRKAGLEIMINYGVSPFDATTPMRPDPRSPACAPHPGPGCPTLDDVWSVTNQILDEAVAHPQDDSWENDFRSNLINEAQGRGGRQVVGLITNSNLGGRQDRDAAAFAFARVKLFAIPVGINTGDDHCPDAPPGGLCNRHGVYPDLVGLRLGEPIDTGPGSQNCEPQSTVHCVWSRRYANGASVVNVSGHGKFSGPIVLGVDGCRYVKDLGVDLPLAENQCVTEVQVLAPPWTGHPLAYSTKPW